MRIRYTREFIKNFKKLPAHIQDSFEDLQTYLESDCFHLYLHTKLLKGRFKNLYSFRVTRNYRVIFKFETDEQIIVLYSIQSRQDAYKN